MSKKVGWPDFWLERSLKSLMLLPLAKLVEITAARRLHKFKEAKVASKVPTLVVGNISVGGSGKTPFIMCLGKRLCELGISFGVVSRGYGGEAASYPQVVTPASDAREVGDEPVLIANTLGCPLVVSPKRAEAVDKLLEIAEVDLIISDDGLQHYALPRDIEVVMLDSTRANTGLGNSLCMPAGPLRESFTRLADVDYVVFNGGAPQSFLESRAALGEMSLEPFRFRNLATGEVKTLEDFKATRVSAVAGIGNPKRFFNTLVELGIGFEAHAFPDHHNFAPVDFLNMCKLMPVIMTAKDAVKCKDFAEENWWSLDVEAQCSEDLLVKLLADIQQLIKSRKEEE